MSRDDQDDDAESLPPSVHDRNPILKVVLGSTPKTKFTCPDCGQNAWAKPDALLICGSCYEDGEGDICLMLAEPSEEAEAA